MTAVSGFCRGFLDDDSRLFKLLRIWLIFAVSAIDLNNDCRLLFILNIIGDENSVLPVLIEIFENGEVKIVLHWFRFVA